jgi:hypothetical protein
MPASARAGRSTADARSGSPHQIVRACLLPALVSAALLAGACGDDDTRARTDREKAGTPEPTSSPEPRTFDEVVEVLYEQIAPDAVDGTLTRIRKSRLDGAAARVWLYYGKRKTGRIRVAQVAALKGNAVYTITFSAHPKSSRSGDELKLILDTWRWSG